MENLWFWAVAGAMTVGVAGLILLSLRRVPQDAPAPAGTLDLQVYRDQMAEVDRDLARGTLAETEAARLRNEIGRRILEADRSTRAAAPIAGAAKAGVLPALGVALVCVSAFALYAQIGAPGYPDMPLKHRLQALDAGMASRPSQAEMVAKQPPLPAPEGLDPDFLTLMEKLRAAVDPATATDQTGLELLARNEAALGNFAASEAAMRRLIAVKADAATAEDFAGLAEILIRAAGGYVSPEAEAELIHALERDPRNGTARYFSGMMFAQGGRFDRAFGLWQPLLEEGPPDAPWIAAIRDQIGDVADLAGINYTPPDAKGPTAADMAAAADMTPEERQQMIEGMVGQLSERLSSEGGPVEDWAKLVRSLAMLGRKDDAQKAYDDAKSRFAGKDADLATLAATATDAGLAP